jgi:hypothetical protein
MRSPAIVLIFPYRFRSGHHDIYNTRARGLYGNRVCLTLLVYIFSRFLLFFYIFFLLSFIFCIFVSFYIKYELK